MEDNNKEGDIDQYCKTCKHENLPETDDPCDECLQETVNVYSHKPVKWKEK